MNRRKEGQEKKGKKERSKKSKEKKRNKEKKKRKKIFILGSSFPFSLRNDIQRKGRTTLLSHLNWNLYK